MEPIRGEDIFDRKKGQIVDRSEEIYADERGRDRNLSKAKMYSKEARYAPTIPPMRAERNIRSLGSCGCQDGEYSAGNI